VSDDADNPLHPIEDEFGVPFPGLVKPREQWTRTALKRWPSEGCLDWQALFGRFAPVVIDLGCGNGRFLIGSALARPERDHLGVDVLPMVIRYARKRGNQRGLTNARFAVGEAQQVLKNYVPRRSVSEIHVYHPQPYHDPAQMDRRLMTPEFFLWVRRSLVPSGMFIVQTDERAYWEYFQKTIPALFAFTEHRGPWRDAPKGRTRREIIAIRRKLKIYRGIAVVRSDMDDETARRIAADLPEPEFHTVREAEVMRKKYHPPGARPAHHRNPAAD
jgi:tRNA (guanine-N7-)-methyltransferase